MKAIPRWTISQIGWLHKEWSQVWSKYEVPEETIGQVRVGVQTAEEDTHFQVYLGLRRHFSAIGFSKGL